MKFNIQVGYLSVLIRTVNSLESNLGSEKHLTRLLDISIGCQEELSELQKLDAFQVQFPSLSEEEFIDYCSATPTKITCIFSGTSLVSDYRKICEDDAGGKMIQINMEANGDCVGNINVLFFGFPTCAGQSCEAANFVQSYEDKLKTDTEVIGTNCEIRLNDSAFISTKPSLLIIGITATLALFFGLLL